MKITVYTKENCVQCDQTKKILDKNNISYEVKNLADDPEQVSAFIAQGFQAAPIVQTDKEIWSGFRVDKLKDLVDQARLDKSA